MNATIRIVPCALPDREAPSIRVTAMRGLDEIPVEIPADRSEPLGWGDITGHWIRHFRMRVDEQGWRLVSSTL